MTPDTIAITIAVIALMGVIIIGMLLYRSTVTGASGEMGSGFTELMSAYRHELNTLRERLSLVEKDLARTRVELAEALARIIVLEAENTVLRAQLMSEGIRPLTQIDQAGE